MVTKVDGRNQLYTRYSGKNNRSKNNENPKNKPGERIQLTMLHTVLTGAAGATAISQFLAVGIYGTMLWRGARAGTMAVPFFISRGKNTKSTVSRTETGMVDGSQGDDGEEERQTLIGSSESRSAPVKALPLLMTVISANAAMLLR